MNVSSIANVTFKLRSKEQSSRSKYALKNTFLLIVPNLIYSNCKRRLACVKVIEIN